MSCAVCGEAAAIRGVLCDGCGRELAGSCEVSVDQISMSDSAPTSAALVDSWGQPYRLDPVTTVGRHVDGNGLAIIDGSVSRRHASIVRELDHWTVTDHDSTNGTYLENARITGPRRLWRGARLQFANVAFFFLDDSSVWSSGRPPRASSPTLGLREQVLSLTGTLPAVPVDESQPVRMTFRLLEPVGGGAALVEIEGRLVQLTLPQYELVRALVARMQEQEDLPPHARGFVPSSQLLRDISWDTREPADDHLSQLVRRVRRGLVRAEVGDIIESRQGFGYRLRVLPRVK